ncbi:hypothetical protein GF366_05030 [Candidatus Peregrinibacteria bacterium]|nr:hypothetical protein [Candidatus Peregrinibacteria bacterium]
MNKKTYLNLIILFALILTAKVIISLFMQGPFVFSDEACILLKAKHFAETLEIKKTCAELLQIPAGEPLPLYSIIISPLFLFLKGTKAYHGILILNSLLISSLVFPLYSIFKKFLRNNKIIFLYILLILLLPQIVIYEKMLMTECLFIVINIWLLYFYLKSFERNKHSKINKFAAILLSILATLTRPFGFIVPSALVINEIIRNKNRKLLALVYIPLTVILISLILYKYPHFIDFINIKAKILQDPETLWGMLKAVKDQINSFTVTTFLAPLIIFFTYITKKDSKPLNDIKYYLIALISLNFIITALLHSENYSINQLEIGLLTRYINISIILIFIFSLIFLQKYKKFRLKKLNSITLLLVFASLLFIQYKYVKHALNLDISIYYHTTASTDSALEALSYNLVLVKQYLVIPLLTLYFVLLALFVLNKRKILTILLSITIFIHFIFSTLWIVNFSVFKSPIFEYFRDKETNILFLGKADAITSTSYNYWKILTLSNNKLLFKRHTGADKSKEQQKLPQEVIEILKKDFNYIVTPYKFENLTLKISTDPEKTGEFQKEYAYKL